MAIPERLLHRVERLPGQSLDGDDRLAVGLDGQHQTRTRRPTVDEDRAGTAHPELTRHVDADQA
jgi:hypothetical protein